MPVSTNFATMKVRQEFLAWLRLESVRRGIFLYELVEEMASQALVGKRPWARQMIDFKAPEIRRSGG
jgi:hypothetical protein